MLEKMVEYCEERVDILKAIYDAVPDEDKSKRPLLLTLMMNTDINYTMLALSFFWVVLYDLLILHHAFCKHLHNQHKFLVHFGYLF